MFHKQQAASAQKQSQDTDTQQNKQDPSGQPAAAQGANQTTKKEGATMAQSSDNNAQQANRTPDIPNTQGAGYPAGRGFGAGQFGAGTNYGAQGTSSANSRQLIIGQGITMSGEITSCDHLIVEGHVEAALKGASVLDVSENGSFNGEVEIEQATIAGRFEGDIRVSGRLTVKSGGFIKGTISYGELTVEAGATLDGKLAPFNNTDSANKNKSGKSSSAKATASKSDAEKNSENDNSGSKSAGGRELPFAASAAE